MVWAAISWHSLPRLPKHSGGPCAPNGSNIVHSQKKRNKSCHWGCTYLKDTLLSILGANMSIIDAYMYISGICMYILGANMYILGADMYISGVHTF